MAITSRLILKIGAFIVWLILLMLFAFISWGTLAIDRALIAFQTFLIVAIIWLVIGIVGFGWRLIKSKVRSST
ncbi:MAG: hypothetical protein QXY08_03720 [Nitrososphaerales archaeon]